MQKRAIIYSRSAGTELELVCELRQAVEDRGDTVVAAFVDDDRIVGRGKYTGWRGLLAKLDGVDQVIVGRAGDLPGRTVQDVLKILNILRDHGVTLFVYSEKIDTGTGSASAMLDVVEAYRRTKLSAAIREGQAAARAAGKRIGRPKVPSRVRDQIMMALTRNAGVRPIARQYAVSPATVINIRRSMTTGAGIEAA
jgi:DNA invertase Pin-like site-specific DNA recombinase